MPIQQDLIQWHVEDVRCHRGGRIRVPVEQAPFGRILPYRRSAGEHPEPGCSELVRSRGWIADLGRRGIGELLLGLSSVTALREVTGEVPLHYSGPEAELMRRCSIPVETTKHTWGPHVVRTATAAPVRFRVAPEEQSTWLDQIGPDEVEVHAALPMRHYLTVEQNLGRRLSAECTPAPRFTSGRLAEPWHVVFVAVPGWPRNLEFQLADFAAVARALTGMVDAPWRFTVVTARNTAMSDTFDGLPVDVVREPGAARCVDLFASAELVVGTDSGLTQLAALTERADDGGPQVVGLYSRHAHIKWTTGLPDHHAIATRFAQMLALADRSADTAELTDTTWSAAADLRAVPPELVADFAARCAGWR
ncbi:glycosyl transferase family 9 [Saccharopolyspora gloriosae]|uniref:glycosyl transferase family 9 n=1 Tax=Saccharopolyspora gloriosae TaxID=455344 RepID=UPI001FB62ABC|nr:glycosyl transferase family 9 [Saccharopolyspora gloriosae]